jgi:hypothetical protein
MSNNQRGGGFTGFVATVVVLWLLTPALKRLRNWIKTAGKDATHV